MGDMPPGDDDDVLAGKLADARRRLGEIDLPAADLSRLYRQFIAVCDAIKISDSDQTVGLRRLAAFLSTLDQAAANNHGGNRRIDESTS